MSLVTIPDEFDFCTKFPTWIIAYCPDTDSWFCTNQRFFYYEYPKEFECECDSIEYFRNNVPEFASITRGFHHFSKKSDVFLENTGELWTQNVDITETIKLKDLCVGNPETSPFEED